MPSYRALAGLLALALSPACAGCEDSSAAISTESQRLWGRDHTQARWMERAQSPIDPRVLDTDAETRRRVLRMPIEEVVARLGFVRYQGTARFVLERNDHHIEVYEDTVIDHGLHGSWRVAQRDEDGTLLREKVFANGLYYLRNGPGALRAQGVADRPGTVTRSEAFEPLAAFTGWFGDQLALDRVGPTEHESRPAIEYRYALGGGGGLVRDPGQPDRRLRPETLSGQLWVDEATGAPVRTKLRGTLGVEPPPGSRAWGRLEVALDFRVVRTTGKPVEPTEHVPPIEHRPVDLDPLGFLEGQTRTSTVIGGPGR